MLKENLTIDHKKSIGKLTPFYWLDVIVGIIGGMASNLCLYVALLRLFFSHLCDPPPPRSDINVIIASAVFSLLCYWPFRKTPYFARAWVISGCLMVLPQLLFVYCEGFAGATLPIPPGCGGE